MHETLTEKSFLGLERNFCSEKEVKTVVPKVPITWMYNVFVWKMQAQIAALANSDQDLQPSAPRSSLMLHNEVIHYSGGRMSLSVSFVMIEKNMKTRLSHHLHVKQEYSKILPFSDQDSNLLVCHSQRCMLQVFRPWARE